MNGFKDVKKWDMLQGKWNIIRSPLFKTVFVMRVRPKPGSEVPLYKIKLFLVELKNKDIPIAKITMDGFQSTNMRQDLVLQGFKSELLSVDRTKDPYDTLKNAILEERWTGPYNYVLERELKKLQDFGKKIDHPTIGTSSGHGKNKTEIPSKDLADACAGSIYSCFTGIEDFGAAFDIEEFMGALDDYTEGETNIYEKISKGMFG